MQHGFPEAVATYQKGHDPALVSEGLVAKKWNPELKAHFISLAEVLGQTAWEEEALGNAMRNYIKENGLKFGDVFKLLRVALAGSDQGPDIAGMFKALGRDEALRRLNASLAVFDELSSNE